MIGYIIYVPECRNTNTKSKTLPSNIFHEFVGVYGTCLNFFTMAVLPHFLICAQDEVDAKVLVAGLSTTCSQKIHNQLVRNKVTTWYKVFANANVALWFGSFSQRHIFLLVSHSNVVLSCRLEWRK